MLQLLQDKDLILHHTLCLNELGKRYYYVFKENELERQENSITFEWRKNSLKFFLDKEQVPYFEITDSHQEFYKYKYPFNRAYYMIINVAVGGKYDDFWVDKNAFCSNEE